MKDIKPLGYRSYGTIPHFEGSRVTPADKHCEPGQQKIVTEKTRDRHDLIIVQEKVDGSNCTVAKLNGQIIALGRAGYLAETSPFVQHHYFAQWVNKWENRFNLLLNEGERICGEWMAQAHGTRYDLPHEPFIVFDLFTSHLERLIYHEFLLRVLPLGFTVNRLIHIGQPISLKEVLKRLEPSGHGALDSVEGAVFRCERLGKVDFLCKFVRPEKQDGIYLPEISGKEPVWNINISEYE
jgi:hypothetical protein